MTMKLFSAGLATIRDALGAVAGDDGRPVLTYAKVSTAPGILKIEATDSYLWVERTVPVDLPEDAEPTSILVDADLLRRTCKALVKSELPATLDVTPEALTVGWGQSSSLSLEAKEGTWPPTSRIPQPSRELAVILLWPELIARAARCLGVPDRDGVRLTFSGELSSIRISTHLHNDVAYIMPRGSLP
jgi:DNA polymerase III sliding clamp (beta) subunit (PCNA family)